MKPKALILDAGGVLVHPLHGDWNIPARYRELLGAYASDIPGPRWTAATNAARALLREDYAIPDIAQEYDLRLQYLRRVAKDMGWTLSDESLIAAAQDFTYNPDRYALYSDTIPMLGRWQGEIRMGVLSDAMPSFRKYINVQPLGRFFEAVAISTEVGAAKPDARMYAAICAKMNLAPADCLFVDDRPCNLVGAQNAGMAAVQMCRDGLAAWSGDAVRNLSELDAYWRAMH